MYCCLCWQTDGYPDEWMSLDQLVTSKGLSGGLLVKSRDWPRVIVLGYNINFRNNEATDILGVIDVDWEHWLGHNVLEDTCEFQPQVLGFGGWFIRKEYNINEALGPMHNVGKIVVNPIIENHANRRCVIIKLLPMLQWLLSFHFMYFILDHWHCL